MSSALIFRRTVEEWMAKGTGVQDRNTQTEPTLRTLQQLETKMSANIGKVQAQNHLAPQWSIDALRIAKEQIKNIPSNTDSIPKSRLIVLRERGGPLQVIAESHRTYDALQYVLMFPFGDDGWHRESKTAQNKKITLM